MQEKIKEIKTDVQQKVQHVLYETKEDWDMIFDILKKDEEIEIHDGELELLSISFSDGIKETVVVWNEQSIDFLIAKEQGERFSVYQFLHYYDQEGHDCSLLKNVLKENTIEQYSPLCSIQQYDSSHHDNAIYDFYDIKYFYSIFECIMADLEDDNPRPRSMDMFDVERFVKKQIGNLFKVKKDELIAFYEGMKKKQIPFSYDNNPYGVKKIRLSSNENAVIFEQEKSQFSLVFQDLHENERGVSQHIQFFHRIEETGNEMMYEFFYIKKDSFQSEDIKLDARLVELYGVFNDIHFFSPICEFLQLFEFFFKQTK